MKLIFLPFLCITKNALGWTKLINDNGFFRFLYCSFGWIGGEVKFWGKD
nr:MAG TPA: hypothetical protein [Caudoviricetes sp.]